MVRFGLILTSALVALSGSASARPMVGQPAPAFTVADESGKQVALAQYRGKPVVLEWTNNGCPYVRHMYNSGVMQSLQKKARQDGFVWLSVVSSAPGQEGFLRPSEVAGWRRETGASPADVLLDTDGKVGRTYDARATPTMFIIDPSGAVAYMGGIDDRPSTDPADAKTAKNYVTLAMDDLKSHRPIAEPVTRAYGCSVKY